MITKEFPAAKDAFEEVSLFVEEQLDLLECPMKAAMQISIAVEEIFVNIASYAYEGKPGTMTLTIDCNDGVVSFRFADKGVPFDPLAKPDPDIAAAADERQIGGLGIYMVKKSMDSVTYEYTNGENILTFTKKM